jgi:hypothetical protein
VGLERGPGLQIKKSSRGAAFGDIDNDGDVDIAIVNIDNTPTLLRNDGGNASNWLMVRLLGEGGNTQAIGARVIADVAGKRQLREVHSGTGYISQDDMRLHFGLGMAQQVDRLELRWPDGREEVLYNVLGNRLLTIAPGSGIIAEGFGPWKAGP